MTREELSVQSLMNEKIDALERNLDRRLTAQDQALIRIEGKVDKTNGRVTTLEKARERAQGVMFAFSWLPPVIASAVTAGLTVLIMAISGGLH